MTTNEKLLEIQMRLANKGEEPSLENLRPLLRNFKVTVFFKNDIVVFNGKTYFKTSITFKDCESDSCVVTHTFTEESENVENTGMIKCLKQLFLI